MPSHVADIPRPMYGYVKNQFLHDHQYGHGNTTECLLYGLSALPGRAWGISALMNNGALVQHLPVHAFTRNQEHEMCSEHGLEDLQVWSCYGQDFATHEYSALKELPVRAYMYRTKNYKNGRYWFTAAPYDDYYSMTPDQHKHFNFIWLDCGCLASLPGNRLFFYDSSFVEIPRERPRYRVNTSYWFPEKMGQSAFDAVVDPFTG